LTWQAQAAQAGLKLKCTARPTNSPVNSQLRSSAGESQLLNPIECVKRAVPEMTVFASGGIKDGLDIAKCVALGATLGGMAGQFLKAAAISTEKAVEMMKLTKRQIEVTMFACGAGKLANLSQIKFVPV
jgi:isopentenyl diphosphate isomerase/L-lactate dehydrogenase-like FMN-dependent dehydrogenase